VAFLKHPFYIEQLYIKEKHVLADILRGNIMIPIIMLQKKDYKENIS